MEHPLPPIYIWEINAISRWMNHPWMMTYIHCYHNWIAITIRILLSGQSVTQLLHHIDNNAQQTQHEPHSGTNYHDKNQYNNTANTQDTTKSTHARTAPNTNTKSVETETRTIMPNNNTKHMKQIRTQTGHKHNALDQSRETYEISTKISNGLNDMVGEKRM